MDVQAFRLQTSLNWRLPTRGHVLDVWSVRHGEARLSAYDLPHVEMVRNGFARKNTYTGNEKVTYSNVEMVSEQNTYTSIDTGRLLSLIN